MQRKATLKKKYLFNLLLSISVLLISLIIGTYIYSFYNTPDSVKNNNQTEETEENNDKENTTEDNEDITELTEEEIEPELVENEEITTNTTQDNTNNTTQSSTEETEEDTEETTETPSTPESPSAVVAFYSDNQSDTDSEDINHQNVVNNILNSGANPVFSAGDIMEDGTQDSLDRFNNVTSTLRSTRTFYSALGNNDRKVGDSSTPSDLYLNNFIFPNNERWYSVNFGNLHVVVLDSSFGSSSSTQIDWLTSDLQSANSKDRITCVVFHHPSFSTTITSLLVDNGVDFVVTGHLHSYSHTISNNIHYFVLSGQPNIGYMTAKIFSASVIITVYNNSNNIVDYIEFVER